MKPSLVRVIVIASIVLVLAAAGFVYYRSTRVYTVTIGTATEGNISYTFGQALKTLVARENPRINLEVVETKGAVESMQMLGENKLDLAVVQNDTPAVPAARTIAFLYPQYFHLLVPIDSPIQEVGDLRGMRVGTPAVGGGSYNAFMTLIEHYGLTPDDFAAFENLPSSELTARFLAGELDAIFGSDAIGEERPTVVLGSGKARVVTIDQAAAMQLTLPYVEELTIPKGAYKASPPVPPEDLTTVGICVSLLAHKELDEAIVKELTRIMFDFRLELADAVPQMSALSSPAESATLSIPIHEGAQAYYDRDKPNFLQENSDYIGLLITLATMAGSVVLAMRARIAAMQKNRSDQYNQEIVDLMDRVRETTDLSQVDDVERRLFKMFEQVINDLDKGNITAETLGAFTLSWNQAIETVRHRRLVLAARPGQQPVSA